MSNIYTIRPDSSQSKDVKKLMDHYGVGHASKALLMAAKDLPDLKTRNIELQKRLDKLKDEYIELLNALRERQAVELKIHNIIKTGE